MNEFEVVVGLEFHVQVFSRAKLFSCSHNFFSKNPNSNINCIDVGLPGVLPSLNKRVINSCVLLGLSLNSTINPVSVFSRKHYFYPDLPKNYQITQYQYPICTGGVYYYPTHSGVKSFKISRIHIEEDAARTINQEENTNCIDYNRAGAPLLEVITEPTINSSEEAADIFLALKTLVMYLGISDGNLENGSIRVDANISIRKIGSLSLGVRTEIKNLNSIKFLKQAIEYEYNRQVHHVVNKITLHTDTRLWDPVKKETRVMRNKQNASEYYYLPEPDLPHLELSQKYINKIKRYLPELPLKKFQRYVNDFSLSSANAIILISDKQISDYYEAVLYYQKCPGFLANWIINEMKLCPAISAAKLATLIQLVDSKKISNLTAKKVYQLLLKFPTVDPNQIIKEKNWELSTQNSSISDVIKEMFRAFPGEVKKYKAGKTSLLGFFVGKLIPNTMGKIPPDELSANIKAALEEFVD